MNTAAPQRSCLPPRFPSHKTDENNQCREGERQHQAVDLDVREGGG